MPSNTGDALVDLANGFAEQLKEGTDYNGTIQESPYLDAALLLVNAAIAHRDGDEELARSKAERAAHIADGTLDEWLVSTGRLPAHG